MSAIDATLHAKKAFDTAKKQQSISFAKWINKQGYREYDESDRWIKIEESHTVYTTSQLYEKFEKESHAKI